MDPVGGRSSLKEGSPEYELFRACQTGNIGLVKELLKQDVNIDFQNDNEDRYTALHHAVKNGHSEIVELLIQASAKANLKTNRLKYTPLLLLTSHNDIPNSEAIVHALIKAKDCNINEADYRDFTVLHHLIINGQTELLKFFVDLGCKVNIQDYRGVTPLYVACSENNADAVKVLLAADACTDTTIIFDGYTPLHNSASRALPDIVQLLLQKEADYHKRDYAGNTPLHISMLKCEEKKDEYLQAAKHLLKAGADVNYINSEEQTPLHIVAEKDHVVLVQLLLEAGAYPDAQDISGNTPLYLAAMIGLLQNVKALLAGKSSMNIRNKHRASPFHCVTHNILSTTRYSLIYSLALLKVFLGAGAVAKVELRDGIMDSLVKDFLIILGGHKTVDLADIAEFLHLLHEARFLSSSTTKHLLAIVKHELRFPSLKCLVRTCTQLHMRYHTAEAYAELGLPPNLQKYVAYEDTPEL